MTRRNCLLAELDDVTLSGQAAQIQKGLMMREETIIDLTLFSAPTSTKNKDGSNTQRCTRQKWVIIGMKAHVGVEASSGLPHTVIGTAGNVADVVRAHTLPHGDDFATFGDVGCHGVEKRPENIVKSVI